MNEINKKKIENQFASFCCKVSKHALTDYCRREESRKRKSVQAIPFSSLKGGIGNVEDKNRADVIENIFIIESTGDAVSVRDDDLAYALNLLPPSLRDVILLYFIMEMNDREIGSAMGVSHQRVSSKRKKALNRLIKVMTLGGQA